MGVFVGTNMISKDPSPRFVKGKPSGVRAPARHLKKTLTYFEEPLHMMLGKDVNMAWVDGLVKWELVGRLEFISVTKIDMVG